MATQADSLLVQKLQNNPWYPILRPRCFALYQSFKTLSIDRPSLVPIKSTSNQHIIITAVSQMETSYQTLAFITDQTMLFNATHNDNSNSSERKTENGIINSEHCIFDPEAVHHLMEKEPLVTIRKPNKHLEFKDIVPHHWPYKFPLHSYPTWNTYMNDTIAKQETFMAIINATKKTNLGNKSKYMTDEHGLFIVMTTGATEGSAEYGLEGYHIVEEYALFYINENCEWIGVLPSDLEWKGNPKMANLIKGELFSSLSVASNVYIELDQGLIQKQWPNQAYNEGLSKASFDKQSRFLLVYLNEYDKYDNIFAITSMQTYAVKDTIFIEPVPLSTSSNTNRKRKMIENSGPLPMKKMKVNKNKIQKPTDKENMIDLTNDD